MQADAVIAGPLWAIAPTYRRAVIHERKRRFGWDGDE